MSLVNNWIILLSGKNSFPITFKIVYKGTAITIPNIPNKKPAIRMTKKISKGCELTLLEKIMGWDRLLSISCTIQNPIKTYIVVGSISVWKSLPRWLIIERIAAKTDAISGPM